MARDFVTIRHPKTGGESEVSPLTFARWESLGWELVEPGSASTWLPKKKAATRSPKKATAPRSTRKTSAKGADDSTPSKED